MSTVRSTDAVPSSTSSRTHRREALFGSLVLAAVLLACASAEPVFRLETAAIDSTATWVQGRQIVHRAGDSVDVHIAYDRSTSRNHVFQMHVVNRGMQPFVFDPADVWATVEIVPPYLHHLSDPVPVRIDSVPVRDPEDELLRVDLQQSREVAAEMNDRLLDGVALTLEAAGDVTDAASGGLPPEERAADAAEDAEWAAERRADRAAHRRRMAGFNAERFRWSTAAFRKTTLPPATDAGGWLYLPIREDALRVTLHIPLPTRTLQIPYRQRTFEP